MTKPSALELARQLISEQNRRAAIARWKRLNKAQRREATAPGVEAAARKKREGK